MNKQKLKKFFDITILIVYNNFENIPAIKTEAMVTDVNPPISIFGNILSVKYFTSLLSSVNDFITSFVKI